MNKKKFDWAVVGAGPAGIACIGKLLDSGVLPQNILWLDPFFKVGDLGQYWSSVSSNTTVRLFQDFLKAVDSFSYASTPNNFDLNHLSLDDTCTLEHIVVPLQWITNHFQKTVQCVQTTINKVCLSNRIWSLEDTHHQFLAKNIILANGAEPLSLPFPQIEAVALATAMNEKLLRLQFSPNEVYAVFGSSHSAMIVLRHLVNLGAKKIINFYRQPCRYAVRMDDWILFDNTGLKGSTADWARKFIDGVLPDNLMRYRATKENINQFLPNCQKAVYAIGFKARDNIILDDEPIRHNPHTGIIAPGLFGLGIAYPELKSDPFGNQEMQVGLWKFMTYLNKILPLWFKYST